MVEIERKFLIKDGLLKLSGKGKKIKQGYLSVDPARTVRVRMTDSEAFLTIKGKPEGIARIEMEYEIPVNDAEVLLKMCLYYPVEKTRFKEKNGEMTWEIDVFEGENKGLILAEIELDHEDQRIDLPGWIGEEVSSDSRFYNSSLCKKPFSKW